MQLYRAYLMEDGQVWAAVDLSCTDDDEAKRKAENLLNGRDIELWEHDRRVAVLRCSDAASQAVRSAGFR
jgi:hypothetical protein